MPEERVKLVRRSIDAWNRQDLQALRACYRPDAEVDWSRSRSPFKGVYRGRRALETFFGEFWSTWEDVHIEPHDFLEADAEVVVWNTAHMRGREGIEVSAKTALVFTVADGQISCLRLFDEREEALEAVGLSG